MKESKQHSRPAQQARKQSHKGPNYGNNRHQDNESLAGVGGSIGRWLGSKADTLFNWVTGSGDYKVSNNTLLNGNSPPAFRGGARTTIIRHREYLGDVSTGPTLTSGATTWNVNYTIPINAALATSFPWLALIAEEYEEYKFHGLIFEYKSTSSNALNSTNTALGTVVLTTQYNPNNPPFQDKLHAENYEFCSSINPSESILHPVECAASQTQLGLYFTRIGNYIPQNNSNGTVAGYTPAPTISDFRNYDLGVFQLATVGMQAAGINIGELWVTYEVELLKPKLTEFPSIQQSMHLNLNTTTTAAAPFGAAANSGVYNQVTSSTIAITGLPNQSTITATWVSATQVNLGVLPVGRYLFIFQVSGASTAVAYPTITLSGSSIYNGFTYDTVGSVNNGGTTAPLIFVAIGYNISAPTLTGNVLTITGGTYPTAITGGDVWLVGHGVVG